LNPRIGEEGKDLEWKGRKEFRFKGGGGKGCLEGAVDLRDGERDERSRTACCPRIREKVDGQRKGVSISKIGGKPMEVKKNLDSQIG
jgi:hypothetical protein